VDSGKLNPKFIPYLLLIVLALAVIFIRMCRTENFKGIRESEGTKEPAGQIDRNRGFDRRTSFLEYTKHARCRMECRQISPQEVEDVMRNGNINYRKSEVKANPCPTYALEGMTHDGQHVRIVFAQCDYKTKVVTTIDLDHKWQCDCPGDDKKHTNSSAIQ